MKPVFENLESSFGTFVVADKVLFDGESEYQHILLFENKKYGKVLKLDKAFQTSEYDEFTYHEPIVQPAMCSHPNPKKVLVIGGGDGGALKEALKHNTVEKAIMVELDGVIVDLAKKYLQTIHRGAFDDKRAEIIVGDGIDYIKNTGEKFDVIVLDLTDPYSISTFLYTAEFYRMVKRRLTANGILSLHVEMPYVVDEVHLRVAKTVASVFKHARFFYNFVPIYGTVIGFANCSDAIDPKSISPETIKRRICARGVKDLKIYGPDMHAGFMAMSSIVERRIKSPKIRKISTDAPIHSYDELNDEDAYEMLKKMMR